MDVGGIVNAPYVFVQGPSPRLRLIDTTLPNSFWELQQSAYAADNFGFLRYENNIAVPSKSFLVAANGNIGIGTINPGFKLDVAGMVNTSTLLVNSDSPRIRLIDTTLPNSFWELQQSAFFPDNFGFLRYESNSAVAAKSFFIAPTGNVGVGVAAPANKLSVAGVVESTTGGFKFPDGTTQSSAAVTNIGTITGVTAGTGLAGGGTSGNVSLSADFSSVQKRVTGTCASGTAMALIGIDGTVGCNSVGGGGGGGLTLPFTGTGADTPPTVQGVFKVTDTANGPTNTGGGPPDPNTVPGAVVGVGTGTGITAGVIGKTASADGIGVVAISTSAVGHEVPVMLSWSQATSGKVSLFNGMASSPDAGGIELDFAVTPSRNIIQADVGPNGNSTTVFQVNGSGNVQGNDFNANGSINANGPNSSVNGSTLNGGTINGGTINATNITASGSFNGPNVNVGNISATGAINANGGIVTNSIANFGPCNPCTITVTTGNLQLDGGLSMPSGVLTAGSANINGTLFAQNLSVSGTKNFKIDHPLDPANKYLYHASIESSEVMNLYTGTAVLDKHGEAWVTLAEWFEALNRDFRYQLTSIGRFMPVYIAKEITGNRFKIAGGKPGAKVSWQVTGIRHDAYAEAHRMEVEVEKVGRERGKYLYPEEFGQPESLSAKGAREAAKPAAER
ncbi:MAG: hypothetical protein LAN64_00255 [Acidobacteriia bacterium]|nr:hypothetical protein [Terriglobia bacterium]